MRRKGHLHCKLSKAEKIFLARRRASIEGRRRERQKKQEQENGKA